LSSGVASGVSGTRCCDPATDALHLFSPTWTHSVIDPDEKYDVLTRNGALLSDRK